MLLFIGAGYYYSCHVKKNNIDWYDQGTYNPTDTFYYLKDAFGEPRIMDSKENGMALWDKESLGNDFVLEKIMIVDEYLLNEQPFTHYEFLYGYYVMVIPENKICDVLSLSNSISYDVLKNTICVRSYCLDAIYAILVLASKIANDGINISDAKKNYSDVLLKSSHKYHDYDIGLGTFNRNYLSGNFV